MSAARTIEFRNVGRKGFDIRELVATEDGIRFMGYATTFDYLYPVFDFMHGEFDEQVRRGAFAKTLSDTGGKVPLLKGHDWDVQIGHGLAGEEKQKGLEVEGEVLMDVQAGREQVALMKQAHRIGRPMGISQGFETIHDAWETIMDRARRTLLEIKLFEWSLTPFPANDEATVTAVSVRSLLRKLNENGSLSTEQVMALLSGREEAANRLSEPGFLHSVSETLGELRRKIATANP